MNTAAIFSSALLFAGAMQSPAISFSDLMNVTRIADDGGQVLGTGTFSAAIIAGVEQTGEVKKTKKNQYTIAFLGDSMTDTVGSDLGLVRDELRRAYPQATFTLYNYGVGGENIISGLTRVTAESVYLGRVRPPIVAMQPDIVVIESFAYNPFSFEIGALEQHWLSLAYIVDAIRVNLPDAKIVIAAAIAPNSRVFGDGAPGLAFGADDKRERTRIIKQYLTNAIRFAQSQRLPLADAYHPSLDEMGEGKLLYINPGDHIHYSDAGRRLFARTVAEAIATNKLLEE